MSVDTVTALIADSYLNNHPVLFDEGGHTYTITVTEIRRSGADGSTYLVNGVIFQDSTEWTPYPNFWPLEVRGGQEATFDSMTAILTDLVMQALAA